MGPMLPDSICSGLGNLGSGKLRSRFQPPFEAKNTKAANGTTCKRSEEKQSEEEKEKEMDRITYFLMLLVKIFLVLYDFVTIPIYFFAQQPWKKWKAKRTVWAKHIRESDPYSPCIRIVRSSTNPLEGITTMDELFRMSVMRHGTKKCMGEREILAEAEEYYKTGKVFKKLRLGEYQWYSYIDIEQRVETLSRGLLAIGLQPKKQITIFAETRMEWMLACQACFRINVPVATLYATLGEDGIVYGINETDVNYIITSQDLLPKLKNIVSKTPNVTHIVYMENLRPADITGFPDMIKVLPFSEVENLGNTYEPVSKPEPPKPSDLAIIMYTSGSTGVPKGVMMTHKNIVVTSSGLLDAVPVLKEDDIYIGYLPLAHVFEISAECFFFVMGVAVGYSTPHTMTDKSTAVMPGCKGDTSLLRPTILIAVPLMLDRIRKSVNELVSSKGEFSRELFKFSIEYKTMWMKYGFNTPILNRLIFRKIQQVVGGKVRIIACGGAPLSPDTHNFVRMCLDVRLIQAYGMTETAAGATVMALNDYSTGRVGAPLSCCYIKLVDWVEGGYHATDKPHARGEIVIGGECVTKGYLNRPELTEESFREEDGIKWFYTGDIGELFSDGTYKIIDRKKDLVKLQYGEYISLGKVEAELKTCRLVDNICVVGNGFHDHLVALIVPNVEQLKALAASIDRQHLPFHELCQDPAIIAEFSKQIVAHGQKCRLMRTEIPTKVKLCSEEWQPESGLVTAAFKIRRNYIHQFYQSSIDEMYRINNGSKST